MVGLDVKRFVFVWEVLTDQDPLPALIRPLQIPSPCRRRPPRPSKRPGKARTAKSVSVRTISRAPRTIPPRTPRTRHPRASRSCINVKRGRRAIRRGFRQPPPWQRRAWPRCARGTRTPPRRTLPFTAAGPLPRGKSTRPRSSCPSIRDLAPRPDCGRPVQRCTAEMGGGPCAGSAKNGVDAQRGRRGPAGSESVSWRPVWVPCMRPRAQQGPTCRGCGEPTCAAPTCDARGLRLGAALTGPWFEVGRAGDGAGGVAASLLCAALVASGVPLPPPPAPEAPV